MSKLQVCRTVASVHPGPAFRASSQRVLGCAACLAVPHPAVYRCEVSPLGPPRSGSRAVLRREDRAFLHVIVG